MKVFLRMKRALRTSYAEILIGTEALLIAMRFVDQRKFQDWTVEFTISLLHAAAEPNPARWALIAVSAVIDLKRGASSFSRHYALAREAQKHRVS